MIETVIAISSSAVCWQRCFFSSFAVVCRNTVAALQTICHIEAGQVKFRRIK